MTSRGERRFGLPGSLLWVDAKDALRFKTLFSRGVTEYRRGEDKFHKEIVREIWLRSYFLFKDRIKRPRFSETRGNEGYGKTRRMTGRFYNGTSEAASAFRTVTFKTGGMGGFGLPDIPHADDKTRFVWRALEFGLPPSKHKIPPGYWFTAPKGGKIVKAGEGTDDVFGPTLRGRRGGPGESRREATRRFFDTNARGRMRTGAGIAEKRFLRDAWREGTQGLPKRYIDLFGRSLFKAGWPRG